MHPSYQTTVSGIAAALTGIAKSVNQPAKKAKASIHSDAFKRAHAKVREFIAFERSRPSSRNWKPSVSERRYMFGKALKDAYAMIRYERNDTPVSRSITLEECLNIGSDSYFSDRRGV